MNKSTLIASTKTLEQLELFLKTKYFYNPKISIKEVSYNQYSILNNNKFIEGLQVRLVRGRYRLEMVEE